MASIDSFSEKALLIVVGKSHSLLRFTRVYTAPAVQHTPREDVAAHVAAVITVAFALLRCIDDAAGDRASPPTGCAAAAAAAATQSPCVRRPAEWRRPRRDSVDMREAAG